MISVGAKNRSQAIKELGLAETFLVERGFIVPFPLEPKTQNIVLWD